MIPRRSAIFILMKQDQRFVLIVIENLKAMINKHCIIALFILHQDLFPGKYDEKFPYLQNNKRQRGPHGAVRQLYKL